MEFRELSVGLVLVWLTAKVTGEGMERIGQTAVLGELLAGVIIGPGVLGLVHESEMLHALAELGVLILLFEVGLESDLDELLKAGFQATLVAGVGVILPFTAGFAVVHWLGHPPLLAILVGATLTATSVGITARVLADLGRLQDPAANVVLGAAVVDDILGLIILAVVTGIAQTGGISPGSVVLLTGKAVAFLVVALLIGRRLAPIFVGWFERMRARGTLIVYSLVFAVALAAAADLIGLATIIGAFAAGLILSTTERRSHIEERVKPVADLFVPVFFVTVGMKVQPAMLNPFAEKRAVRHRRAADRAGDRLEAGCGTRGIPVGRATMARRSGNDAAWRGRPHLRRRRPGRRRHRRGPLLGAGRRGDADDVRGSALAEGPVS